MINTIYSGEGNSEEVRIRVRVRVKVSRGFTNNKTVGFDESLGFRFALGYDCQ